MSGEITPGYGRMLTEAREAKGLTVAQVADKLKLTSRQVEALEAEDYSRLPVAVFVRGFIRNYARLVGVSLDSLPAIVEAPMSPTETITAHSEELHFNTSPVRRWLLLPMAVFGLFLILVALLYTWLSQGEEAYVPNPPVASPQPLPLPAVPAPEAVVAPDAADPAAVPLAEPVAPVVPATPVTAPAGVPVPAAAPAVVPPPARPAAPAPLPPPPARAPAPAPAPVTTPAPVTAPAYVSPFAMYQAPVAPAPAPARPGRVVQLVAEQADAWIEVVSGDDKRYARLLHAGEQLTLRGTPPFRLVVGNAAGVRLNYDGRAIDLTPHTGDRVARLTLE